MTDALLRWFDGIDPVLRRRRTAQVLEASFIAAVLNTVVYAVGWISQALMLLITLDLSWLAITVGCAEALFTSDVRKKQSED